jgi:hypothetical protein
MIVLCGEEPHNYYTTLKKSYFTSEQSPESPSPYLNGTIGARLVVVTEIPSKNIVPENLKEITEPLGVTMSARDLYGKPRQFHPFFRLVILSNNEFPLDKPHTGITRRFSSIVHKRVYEEVPTEAHHIQADPRLKRKVHEGEYVHELFYLLICMVPTLWNASDQRLTPLLVDQGSAMQEVEGGNEEIDWTKRLVMEKFLVSCSRADSSPAKIVASTLRGHFKVPTDRRVYEILMDKGFHKDKCNKVVGYAFYYEKANGDWQWVKLRDGVASPAA